MNVYVAPLTFCARLEFREAVESTTGMETSTEHISSVRVVRIVVDVAMTTCLYNRRTVESTCTYVHYC